MKSECEFLKIADFHSCSLMYFQLKSAVPFQPASTFGEFLKKLQATFVQYLYTASVDIAVLSHTGTCAQVQVKQKDED